MKPYSQLEIEIAKQIDKDMLEAVKEKLISPSGHT